MNLSTIAKSHGYGLSLAACETFGTVFLFFFYLNNLFIILKAKVIKQNKPIQNTLSTTNRACRILGMNMMFIVYYLLGLDRKKPQRCLGNILFVILYGGSV